MSNKMTVEIANDRMIKAARWIRENVATPIPTGFSGRLFDADGIDLLVYSSGAITLRGTAFLSGDGMAEAQSGLQSAYKYHCDVRTAAAAIAASMQTGPTYVRRGSRFVPLRRATGSKS